MRLSLHPFSSTDGAPSCVVLVCTQNRPSHLQACLESLSQQEYSNFQVYVVDNASADKSAERIAAEWGAGYIWEPASGLARARNRGARQCSGDIVAYLDDDCIAERQWLSALVKAFTDPDTMAVTGRIIPLENEARNASSGLNDLDIGPTPQKLSREFPLWFEKANFGGIGTGGNMAFRRAAFDEWDGFDVRLGRGAVIEGGEEQYAFFSLIDRGFNVVYTPDAVVRHPQQYETSRAKARYVAECSTATAYLTFLFLKEPRYRRALLQYAVQALLGRQRQWRRHGHFNIPRNVSRRREFMARLAGPCICAKLLFKRVTSQLVVRWFRAPSDRHDVKGCVGSIRTPRPSVGSGTSR
jgi:O-antigen biosynthesis protein